MGKALNDSDAGDVAKAKTEAATSLASLDAIDKEMSATEYGKWKNWYRGDWLTGVHRTRELVKDYIARLNNPLAPMPVPLIWNDWEATTTS